MLVPYKQNKTLKESFQSTSIFRMVIINKYKTKQSAYNSVSWCHNILRAAKNAWAYHTFKESLSIYYLPSTVVMESKMNSYLYKEAPKSGGKTSTWPFWYNNIIIDLCKMQMENNRSGQDLSDHQTQTFSSTFLGPAWSFPENVRWRWGDGSMSKVFAV